MADCTETIGRLPIIKNWPIIGRLIGLADSKYYSKWRLANSTMSGLHNIYIELTTT